MDGPIHLKDIIPAAQNNINTTFILLEKSRVKKNRGESRSCMALVADETAAVHFELWGEDCDAFEEGDIVRLEKGIFSNSGDYNKMMVLKAGRRGSIKKIGEFTMAFVEMPNMSEIQWVVDPNNPKKYIRLEAAVLSPHS
ncbi:unnamed protein product [Linum trigynum]|uniref:SOSS complex subunit B homolog n=1 Tax=Linum trigynum TaxID=586398 RepID=A0AAV2F6B7_9ROSI